MMVVLPFRMWSPENNRPLFDQHQADMVRGVAEIEINLQSVLFRFMGSVVALIYNSRNGQERTEVSARGSDRNRPESAAGARWRLQRPGAPGEWSGCECVQTMASMRPPVASSAGCAPRGQPRSTTIASRCWRCRLI
jgi:hypothetical protein